MSISAQRSKAPHPRSLQEVVHVYYDDHLFDFVVINLEADIEKRISITAKLSLGHPSPTVRAMYGRAVEFFKLVDSLMSAGDLVSLARARRLMNFPEPTEFRLGYTAGGSGGYGLGSGTLSSILFDTLLRDPLLRKVLTIEPDSISFVHQVGIDRSSDILATIIKPLLIQYTTEQAQFYGFSASCMQRRTVPNNWIPGTDGLVSISEVVPVDDLGRVFLLLPKEMCRSGPAMTAHQYLRDMPPPTGATYAALSAKERMMRDAAAHPEQFEAFVRMRMSNPDNYQARREYRPSRD
jgi:hypothetical protein